MQLSKKNETAHPNHRLEMFSDGIYAIVITLLVLEIKVPSIEEVNSTVAVWHSIGKLWPSFLALTLGFITIFISWINHHNFLTLVDKTSPQFIVANGYLLFTLILVPFSTAFVAEYLDTQYAQPAIVLYCINRVLHNTGWLLVHRNSVKPYSLFKNAKAVEVHKKTQKGLIFGFVIYVILMLLAWWLPFVALILSILVSIYWLYLGLARTTQNL